ncbi:MAG: MFS transporter [Lachnospiraceae bacterium]|nr:MFS transporter [Lachnospiraceae bacterium]
MRRLSKRKIYRFCAADIAKGLFNGLIGNYLIYFFQPTVKSGIPNLLPDHQFLGYITVMSIITAVCKIVDAVTDPLVAGMSDRCTNPEGRRMPFMKRAGIPYALSVFLIFMAPFREGSALNAVWVTVFFVVYYVAYTFYFIPRNALVPEIIPDAGDRVSYYGISAALFMGSSAFMYAATLFVNILKNAGFAPIWAWRAVFALFTVIGVFCVILTATAFKEKDYVSGTSVPSESILRSIGSVLKNKNFVLFSAGDLFSYVSLLFFETAMLYYITELLSIPESQSFYVMLSAIVGAVVLFPVIISIGKKNGKKTLLVAASFIFTAVFIVIYFGDMLTALMPGHELVIGLAVGIIVAFPFAAINALPSSVSSDIIQKDSIENKVNREGIFAAVKTLIEKMAAAVATAIVSTVLAIGAPEGASVGMLGIKLTGVFAAGFSLFSLIFFILYDEKSVTKYLKEHTKMGEN